MSSKPRLSLFAFHHLSFEISQAMNLMVMIIYWGTLHAERIKRPDAVDPLARFAIYSGHLAPFVFSYINFFITDVVISKRHSTITIPIGILYMYANYKETIRTGEPLYWFATWEDIPKTCLVFVGLMMF